MNVQSTNDFIFHITLNHKIETKQCVYLSTVRALKKGNFKKILSRV